MHQLSQTVINKAFSLLIWLFRTLPPTTLVRVGRASGSLAYHISKRERRINNAQIKFALPDQAPESLSRAVFRHVGELAAESLMIERIVSERVPNPSNTTAPPRLARFTSEGDEFIARIRQQGLGAVCLSGHLGSFELLAAYHVQSGIPLSVIGRVPNYTFLADVLSGIRAAYGVDTIWRDEKGSAKKIVRAVKRGGFVAALIDQDTALESGFAPYFGLEASFPIALIQLAVQQKMPLLSSFIYRTGELRHHVVTEELSYEPDDPEAINKVLLQFSARQEKLVREHPEQWIWWHKRWRRRPGVDYTLVPLPPTEQYISWMEGLSSGEKN